MQLILTEKPSVARDIARVLTVDQKHDGFFSGNGYYISWAFGHLIKLAEPETYRPEYGNWSLDVLPMIPEAFQIELQDNPSSQKQFHTIASLMNKDDVDTVICATDAGREGELIFRHIYTKAGCAKPILRLWISSQTDQAIREGFASLKDGTLYDPLYDSARCRSEADWLVGLNATRAYTIKFSKGSGIMSVGRVQTPVLKLIVDRYQANINFKPETYFEISAEIDHPNGTYPGLWINDEKEARLFDANTAKALHEALKPGAPGTVAEALNKQKKEAPPLLYDLTELQKDANRKFSFSAEHTLTTLQGLYERHKLVTYPRTSSRYLSDDLKPKMAERVQHLAELPDYSDLAQPLTTKPLPFSKRFFNNQQVTDHHAIIPTEKKAVISQLSSDELKLYDLIVRRFLASFYPDCDKDTTEIITSFGPHRFRTFGTMITNPGWRAVYGNDAEDEDADALLPVVKAGDAVTGKTFDLNEKKTKAPPLYTEASILAAMETAGKTIDDEALREAMKNCGLGTPATRAQILERLLTVQYIVREKKNLVPTPKGIQLISYIQTPELMSAELTGGWEKKLNDMVQKNYQRETYMSEIKAFTQDLINQVKASTTVAVGAIKDSLGPCPKCSGAVVETKMAYGCSQWKATECSFKIWKTIAGKEITSSQAKALLKTKKSKVIKGFKSKEGKTFEAALAITEAGDVVFDFAEANAKKSLGTCPICGEGQITETPKGFGCDQWRTTQCRFVIWKDIAGKKIDEAIVKTLLKKGETELLDGFKSKAGKPFSAKLMYKDGRVEFVFNP
ncbi:MAG: DNA topoisomerase 3 [Candidatus Margulisiibacteriota bacterium]